MILDVSSILAIPGKSLSFNETISNDNFTYDKTICEIIVPINVSGKVSNIGGAFNLSLIFKTKVKVYCARCTKELERNFSFALDETLTKEGNEIEVNFTGNTLDITQLLSNAFMSNIEYKYLCSDECRGLCPSCGADLNEGLCNCKSDDLDPRFAVLKKLLKDT